MIKGQKVVVSHPSYPATTFDGVVIGAARQNGFFKVRYFSWGVSYTETFSAARLASVA